jgi:hypothetical protein
VNRFRSIAITVVAGFVLVACGPAASGSSAPSAGGAASQAAQASSGGGPGPSFTAGAVADLEALIPDTIGGVTMQKQSMQGNQYLVGPNTDPATVKFLQDLGVSPNDISMAVGFGFAPAPSGSDTGVSVIMFVFRAKGADGNKLVAGFKQAALTSGESPLEWANANVGGKQVQTASQSGQLVYLYVKDDILFFIGVSSEGLAQQILSGLP